MLKVMRRRGVDDMVGVGSDGGDGRGEGVGGKVFVNSWGGKGAGSWGRNGKLKVVELRGKGVLNWT